MDANEIIEAIRTAKKKTPVKAYIKASRPLHFENCHVFTGADTVVIGDYEDIAPVIERNSDAIEVNGNRKRLPQQCASAAGHQKGQRAH